MNKNTHMTHIEDSVINGNLDIALELLKTFYDKIMGYDTKKNITFSIKFDGSPAITAWSSFPGLKQAGVSTKGIFNKKPQVFYTNEQINEKYKDRPDLCFKLTTLLKYLPKLKIPKGEIWQGDFLFDENSLQEIDSIYEFHPNTIVYRSTSSEKWHVAKTKIGLVWHTRYRGTLEEIETISVEGIVCRREDISAHYVRGHFKQRKSGIYWWNSFIRGTGEVKKRKAYLVEETA